jgi:rhamnulokinase
MSQSKSYIAVDLGAESGRVMLGTVSESKLELVEMHRFGNGPTEVDGSLRWDFGKLFAEIKTGIAKAAKAAGEPVAGIGVDTWGVDFGLVDGQGELIEWPYHYRDARTNGMMEKAFALMPKREIYENSGIQFMQLNTLYQLLALRMANAPALKKAKHLIFMADLVSYFLSGKIYAEYSLASTSQFVDMRIGRWSHAIFSKLSLPMDIMPQLVAPGTVVGQVKPSLAKELGCGLVPVIATGSHDTADAVAAVPFKDKTSAYLSCGTWSLLGVETPKAIINDTTFKYDFTNEGGVLNTVRLLKNVMGLWLVQTCRKQWQSEGADLSYSQITQMATAAKPFAAYIAPNHPDFLAPGDMPARINKLLESTGQKAISDRGQMIRVILESLALNYRWGIEKLEDITGTKISTLHMVGGGIQNELLCQFAADACGRKVVAGPIEATASGNIIMQAIATGQLKNLQEGRDIVRASFDVKEYTAKDTALWDAQYQKIKHIF